VAIGPDDGFDVFAAFGDGAAAAIGLGETAGSVRAFAGGLAFTDPRLVAAGVRAVLPAGTGTKALEDAGFAPAKFADYDAERLLLGLPDGSRDLEVERSLLLENGFEELNGIDFAKGCYVGQEVTTRMKRRALVRKRLMPVAVEGPVPEPGTIVMRDGIEVGEMRSVAGRAGLALSRLDLLDGATKLSAGEARITPHPPAWLAR
jgi:folate-binding protein YgfZ